MKTLFLTTLFTILTTLSANASSYMYETCSNANATVETKSGHVTPSVTINIQLATADHQGAKEPINLDIQSTEVLELDKRVISAKQTRDCPAGESYGYTYTESLYAKKIIITNKDGSRFPHGVFKLSADRLSVSDYVICESQVTLQISCEE